LPILCTARQDGSWLCHVLRVHACVEGCGSAVAVEVVGEWRAVSCGWPGGAPVREVLCERYIFLSASVIVRRAAWMWGSLPRRAIVSATAARAVSSAALWTWAMVAASASGSARRARSLRRIAWIRPSALDSIVMLPPGDVAVARCAVSAACAAASDRLLGPLPTPSDHLSNRPLCRMQVGLRCIDDV